MAAMLRADGGPPVQRPHHRDRIQLRQRHVEGSGNDPVVPGVYLRKDEIQHRAKLSASQKRNTIGGQAGHTRWWPGLRSRTSGARAR